MTAHSGKLFHPRTTRHFFPFRKPRIDFKFNHTLQSTTSIDYLISSNSKVDELKLNLDYINEIEVEIGKIQAYLEEQLRVKEWLKIQNEFIKDDN
jgi:hypothetical protein